MFKYVCDMCGNELGDRDMLPREILWKKGCKLAVHLQTLSDREGKQDERHFCRRCMVRLLWPEYEDVLTDIADLARRGEDAHAPAGELSYVLREIRSLAVL